MGIAASGVKFVPGGGVLGPGFGPLGPTIKARIPGGGPVPTSFKRIAARRGAEKRTASTIKEVGGERANLTADNLTWEQVEGATAALPGHGRGRGLRDSQRMAGTDTGPKSSVIVEAEPGAIKERPGVHAVQRRSANSASVARALSPSGRPLDEHAPDRSIVVHVPANSVPYIPTPSERIGSNYTLSLGILSARLYTSLIETAGGRVARKANAARERSSALPQARKAGGGPTGLRQTMEAVGLDRLICVRETLRHKPLVVRRLPTHIPRDGASTVAARNAAAVIAALSHGHTLTEDEEAVPEHAAVSRAGITAATMKRSLGVPPSEAAHSSVHFALGDVPSEITELTESKFAEDGASKALVEQFLSDPFFAGALSSPLTGLLGTTQSLRLDATLRQQKAATSSRTGGVASELSMMELTTIIGAAGLGPASRLAPSNSKLLSPEPAPSAQVLAAAKRMLADVAAATLRESPAVGSASVHAQKRTATFGVEGIAGVEIVKRGKNTFTVTDESLIGTTAANAYKARVEAASTSRAAAARAASGGDDDADSMAGSDLPAPAALVTGADDMEWPAVDSVPAAVAHPLFLRLDLSELPLQVFDNDEYETHTPAEWLNMPPFVRTNVREEEASEEDEGDSKAGGGTVEIEGPMAYSPIFVGKHWVWSPVVVTGYDASTELYEVTFLPTASLRAAVQSHAAKLSDLTRVQEAQTTSDGLDGDLRARADARPTSPEAAATRHMRAAMTPQVGEFANVGGDVLSPRAEDLQQRAKQDAEWHAKGVLYLPGKMPRRQVRRLNIRFAAESFEAFFARRAAAAARREAAKAALRYVHFLEGQPGDVHSLAPLREDVQAAILRKSVRASNPLPTLEAHERLVSNTMEEIRQEYAFTGKLAQHTYTLVDPAKRRMHVALRLPRPVPVAPAPLFGLVEVVQSALEGFHAPQRSRIPFSQALMALDEAMQVSTAPVWLPSYWLSRAFHQRFVDKQRVFVDAWLGSRWRPQLAGDLARDALERERTRKNMRRRFAVRSAAGQESSSSLPGDGPDVTDLQHFTADGRTVQVFDVLKSVDHLALLQKEAQWPMSLETFEQRQAAATAELLGDLQSDWRGKFVAELHDAVHNVYNLYMRDPALYAASPLSDMLRRAQLQLTAQLRYLCNQSVDDFIRMLADSSEHGTVRETLQLVFASRESREQDSAQVLSQYRGAAGASAAHAALLNTRYGYYAGALLGHAATAVLGHQMQDEQNAHNAAVKHSVNPEGRWGHFATLIAAGLPAELPQRAALDARTVAGAAQQLVAAAQAGMGADTADAAAALTQAVYSWHPGHHGQDAHRSGGSLRMAASDFEALMDSMLGSKVHLQRLQATGRGVDAIAPAKAAITLPLLDYPLRGGRAPGAALWAPPRAIPEVFMPGDLSDDEDERLGAGPDAHLHFQDSSIVGQYRFAEPQRSDAVGHKPALFTITLVPTALENVQFEGPTLGAFFGRATAVEDAQPYGTSLAAQAAPDAAESGVEELLAGLGSAQDAEWIDPLDVEELADAAKHYSTHTSVSLRLHGKHHLPGYTGREHGDGGSSAYVQGPREGATGAEGGVPPTRTSVLAPGLHVYAAPPLRLALPAGAKLVAHAVQMSPSSASVEDTLLRVLTRLTDAASSIQGIESSLLTLMPLTESPLLPLQRVVLPALPARFSATWAKQVAGAEQEQQAWLRTVQAALEEEHKLAEAAAKKAAEEAVASDANARAARMLQQAAAAGANKTTGRELLGGRPRPTAGPLSNPLVMLQQWNPAVVELQAALRQSSQDVLAMQQVLARAPPSALATETRLVAARAAVSQIVAAEMIRPNALANTYGRYGWLLGLRGADLTRGLSVRRSPAVLAEWSLGPAIVEETPADPMDGTASATAYAPLYSTGARRRDTEADPSEVHIGPLRSAVARQTDEWETESEASDDEDDLDVMMAAAAAARAARASQLAGSRSPAVTPTPGSSSALDVPHGAAHFGEGVAVLPAAIIASTPGADVADEPYLDLPEQEAASAEAAAARRAERLAKAAAAENAKAHALNTDVSDEDFGMGGDERVADDDSDDGSVKEEPLNPARAWRKPFVPRWQAHLTFDEAGRPRKKRVRDERREIRRFWRASQEIARLSADTVEFGLVAVDTSYVKAVLTRRARELTAAMAKVVVRDCARVAVRVDEKYAELLEHLKQKPRDARGVERMRNVLERLDNLVAGLESLTIETWRRLIALGEFDRDEKDVPKPVVRAVLFLRMWPRRIMEQAGSALAHLDLESEKLVSGLEEERAVFEQELTQLPQKVLAFYQKGGGELEATDKAGFDKVAEEALSLQDKLLEATRLAGDFQERERIFEQPLSDFTTLERVKREFEPFFKLWSIVNELDDRSAKWMQSPFGEIDVKDMVNKVTAWHGATSGLIKVFQELNAEQPLEVASNLRNKLAGFREILPVVEALGAKDVMQAEHWQEVADRLDDFNGKAFDPLEEHRDFALADLINHGVKHHMDDVQEVALIASKQHTLNASLQGMVAELRAVKLEVTPYPKDSSVSIIKGVDTIQALLDEQLVKTQNLLTSPYIVNIRENTARFESMLLDATNLLEVWMAVQRSWRYLEPIFGSRDIMRQMPEQGRVFRVVDKVWREIMRGTEAEPSLVENLADPKLLVTLQDSARRLDTVQRGLNKYLELKRQAFPRFYFLSNEELLEILAETKDPRRVQPHLNKSFEGIDRIEFVEMDGFVSDDDEEDDSQDEELGGGAGGGAKRQFRRCEITAMISKEKEVVRFERAVDPNNGNRKGNVELWMTDLEGAMRNTLKATMGRSIKQYAAHPEQREALFLEWPGQIVLAVDSVIWTHSVEAALRRMQALHNTDVANWKAERSEERRRAREMRRQMEAAMRSGGESVVSAGGGSEEGGLSARGNAPLHIDSAAPDAGIATKGLVRRRSSRSMMRVDSSGRMLPPRGSAAAVVAEHPPAHPKRRPSLSSMREGKESTELPQGHPSGLPRVASGRGPMRRISSSGSIGSARGGGAEDIISMPSLLPDSDMDKHVPVQQGPLEEYRDKLNAQLLNIVALVRQSHLKALQRMTLTSLTTTSVHARDVVDELLATNVHDVNDFGWFSQLRYYWAGDAGWMGDDGATVGAGNAAAAAGAGSGSPTRRRGRGGGGSKAAGSGGVTLGSTAAIATLAQEEPPAMPVRIVNATAYYAWEYLGNSSRLVITPLTDRCYRTLMGAVHLLYGGAPEGPAGTGKTESTKDLAKALAVQCVVYNCSERMNTASMAKLFKGLAACGAWACFDEFNRIELEVLSVIAQQIMTIQQGKREQAKRFVFEGTTLELRPSCNVFITMNPGYAGRSELPDNLKALFRPCAMMVPDYAMIAEIMLYGYGFEKAREMSGKIVQVLRLSSEQLSSQKHYDYGMRAVKAILVAAANLKRTLNWGEEELVLKAILDVNLPKFLEADLPLFNGIVGDLFPRATLPAQEDHGLQEAMVMAAVKNKLQAVPALMDKCSQLYDTIAVRHGLMVVGPTGAGKTTVMRTLARALNMLADAQQAAERKATENSNNAERSISGLDESTSMGGERTMSAGSTAPMNGTSLGEGFPVAPRRLSPPPAAIRRYEHVRMRVLNPKALAVEDLYGTDDVNTGDWTDGVLSLAVRVAARDLSADHKWVVCDGPVDAVWIENMNTVLDDNKKLCLQSGEVVRLTNEMRMMFEVGDLKAASPATVSRCGMVYMEPHQLGWRSPVASWIFSLPPELCADHGDFIQRTIWWLLPHCLAYAMATGKSNYVRTSPTGLVSSMLRLLRALLADEWVHAFEMDALNTAAAAAGASGPSATGAAGSSPTGAQSSAAKHIAERREAAAKAKEGAAVREKLEALVVFAAVWSFGAAVSSANRPGFNILLRALLAGETPPAEVSFVKTPPQSHVLHGLIQRIAASYKAYTAALEEGGVKPGALMVPASVEIPEPLYNAYELTSAGDLFDIISPEIGTRAARLSIPETDDASVFDFVLDLGAKPDPGTLSNVNMPSAIQLAASSAAGAEAALSAAPRGAGPAGSVSVGPIRWSPWMAAAPASGGSSPRGGGGKLTVYKIPQGTPYDDIVVPTIDTQRQSVLMRLLLRHSVHVLAVGPTGTGKTVSIAKLLSSLPKDKYQAVPLRFSARTTAQQTQDIIDGAMSKRRAGVYGLTLGRTAVVFVDDLNMPQKEEYGAQPPIELLRQWMDHGGWYGFRSRGKPFRKVADTQFMAAMGLSGGSRSDITQRYLRHFNIISCVPFDTPSLLRIYGAITWWFLTGRGSASSALGSISARSGEGAAAAMDMGPKGAGKAVHDVAPKLVAAAVDIYTLLQETLRPTPGKSHYTFNLRDLSSVFAGVAGATPRDLTTSGQFIRLVGHELFRVFSDRLVDDADKEWFEDLLTSQIKARTGDSWPAVCQDYYKDLQRQRVVEVRAEEEMAEKEAEAAALAAELDELKERSWAKAAEKAVNQKKLDMPRAVRIDAEGKDGDDDTAAAAAEPEVTVTDSEIEAQLDSSDKNRIDAIIKKLDGMPKSFKVRRGTQPYAFSADWAPPVEVEGGGESEGKGSEESKSARSAASRVDGAAAEITRQHAAATAEAVGASFAEAGTQGNTLAFGNFFDGDSLAKYAQSQSDAALLHALMQTLDSYNESGKHTMDIVLFGMAREHVVRIARRLSQTAGHALLVGVGGSGRRCLTRLAAFTQGHSVYSLNKTSKYGFYEWRDDLKACLSLAGVEGRSQVLLLSDSDIISDAAMEDINNILNAGEVPNLFNEEDKTKLITDLQDEATKVAVAERAQAEAEGGAEVAAAGDVVLTRADIFKYFVTKCKRNLHVVLAFSPVGDDFRNRLRNFPALVNCTYVDWFQPWPESALRSVASKVLVDAGVVTPADLSQVVPVAVAAHTVAAQLTVKLRTHAERYNYVTPTMFLQFLRLYQSLLQSRRAAVSSDQDKYSLGVRAIDDAEGLAKTLQKQVEALQPELEESRQRTEAAMQAISVQQAEVDAERSIVAADEKKLTAEAGAAEALMTECQAELDEAKPLLAEAQAALNGLKSSDITEVKSMKHPPEAVKQVMMGVCIIRKVKPIKVNGEMSYWAAANKHLLNDIKFVKKLIKFNLKTLTSKVVGPLRPLLADPEFVPEQVATKSKAAAGLCRWLHAVVSYFDVVQVVLPKEKAVEEARAAVALKMEALAAKQAILSDLEAKLSGLLARLRDANDEKARLEEAMHRCVSQQQNAGILIGSLGGQRDRWRARTVEERSKFEHLTGDALLAAAVVSYLGPFPQEFRSEALGMWMTAAADAKLRLTCLTSLPVGEEPVFSLSAVCGDDALIQGWKAQGLPDDPVSIDNAIMLQSSQMWPLMIDPQEQANSWIRSMEQAAMEEAKAAADAAAEKAGTASPGRNSAPAGSAGSSGVISRLRSRGTREVVLPGALIIVKPSTPTLSRTLEAAVSYGHHVLLEGATEHLDSMLDPLLEKHITVQGGVKVVKLGDNTVEYHPGFKLYITTKLPNPHFAPETRVKVNLLNFSATETGLTDQLLATVVQHEAKELENQRRASIKQIAQATAKVAATEEQVLNELAACQDDLLDNKELIATLQASKVTSDAAEAELEQGRRSDKRVRALRSEYIPVARRAATLYFTVTSLSKLDPMYQFSLQWFTRLFQLALERTTATKRNLPARLTGIVSTFTLLLYRNVCRSLFERHKLLLSLLMTLRILETETNTPSSQIRFLLSGATSIELREPNPIAEQPGSARDTPASNATAEAVSRVEQVATLLEGADVTLDMEAVADASDEEAEDEGPAQWLPDEAWRNLLDLAQVPGFEGVLTDFRARTQDWRGVLRSEEPSDALTRLMLPMALGGEDDGTAAFGQTGRSGASGSVAGSTALRGGRGGQSAASVGTASVSGSFYGGVPTRPAAGGPTLPRVDSGSSSATGNSAFPHGAGMAASTGSATMYPREDPSIKLGGHRHIVGPASAYVQALTRAGAGGGRRGHRGAPATASNLRFGGVSAGRRPAVSASAQSLSEMLIGTGINSDGTYSYTVTKSGKRKWAELTMVEHAILLRCLRPDQLVPALQDLIAETLGRDFVDQAPLDLAVSFADSRCDIPLVFVLAPGADPMTELLKFAESKGMTKQLDIISLGQGQGPKAEAAIQSAKENTGKWVCLQNCHLATSWMPQLEKLVDSLDAQAMEPGFRLWLTSKPTTAFPVPVLQKGVKMILEPPKGVRNSLMGSYAQLSNEYLSSANQGPPFRKLLFGLCFFHAAVLERRSFGPMGWNIPYEFAASDLAISASQMRMFLDDMAPAWATALDDAGLAPSLQAGGAAGRSMTPENAARSIVSGGDCGSVAGDNARGRDWVVPYAALRYLIAECNYGGRVTDDKDRRLLHAMLGTVLTPEILDDSYKFCESGEVFAPEDSTLEGYQEFIAALPRNDTPELFGMHANAAITNAVNESRGILQSALRLQPRQAVMESAADDGSDSNSADGKADDADAPSASMRSSGIAGTVQTILAKLPALFDLDAAARKYPVKHEQSMNTVLLQELARFNNLLAAVRATLLNLLDALKGIVVMSSDTEGLLQSLTVGQVPEAWHAVAYPSLKPLGSWVEDLCSRVDFFSLWLSNGPPPSFWISGFFFTQSFLTGTLQNFARKYEVPIDTVHFEFEVQTSLRPHKNSKPPSDGAHVHGLFLEGAAWDSDECVLTDQRRHELLSPLPMLWLRPTAPTSGTAGEQKVPQHAPAPTHVYVCPVYKTASRHGMLSTTGHSTNHTLDVALPIAAHDKPEKWVKRGAAMLCQTST